MNKKHYFIIFIFSVALILLANWQIVVYGFWQGKGQLVFLSNTVPVEEMMASQLVHDSIKIKLSWIRDIRQFAQDSLGLVTNDNYTTYYEQKGAPILWVVTACEPYELKEYKWRYPILGKLGYKGFFRKELAEKEAGKLSDLGLDVDVGEVNAWSTLGWFKDPILSSMMKKTEGEIARLLIHELTHTTIYIADDAVFNENLATYIGDKGAENYLSAKYGAGDENVVQYLNNLSDIKKISAHMLRGAEQLDKLYCHFDNLSVERKEVLKQEQIRLIISNIDTIKLADENRYDRFKAEDFKPNNTFFMEYQMYRGRIEELDSLLRRGCGNNLKELLRYYE